MEKDLTQDPKVKDKEFVHTVLTHSLPKDTASALPPIVLAWIGDGIFTDQVRKYLMLAESSSIKKLHKLSVHFVKAQSQSQAVHKLLEEELSPEEKEIVRMGRNTNSHVPKSSSISDYRYATGFETLIGWLSLTDQTERLTEISSIVIAYLLDN